MRLRELRLQILRSMAEPMVSWQVWSSIGCLCWSSRAYVWLRSSWRERRAAEASSMDSMGGCIRSGCVRRRYPKEEGTRWQNSLTEWHSSLANTLLSNASWRDISRLERGPAKAIPLRQRPDLPDFHHAPTHTSPRPPTQGFLDLYAYSRTCPGSCSSIAGRTLHD